MWHTVLVNIKNNSLGRVNSYWIGNILGFLCGSDGKESACNAGDPGLIPGSGRFPGEGNGNPLQYSCLENPMDRGAWQAIVHGVVRVVTIKVFDAFQYWIICISEVSEMSDSLWPHGLWSTRVLYPWNSSGKTTGVGCPFLLQGIFPTRDPIHVC